MPIETDEGSQSSAQPDIASIRDRLTAALEDLDRLGQTLAAAYVQSAIDLLSDK
jgi:hypothetical protein